jgi:uncharacterized iron-regulated membrane protein
MKKAEDSTIAFKTMVFLNGLGYVYSDTITNAIASVIHHNGFERDEEQVERVKEQVIDALKVPITREV